MNLHGRLEFQWKGSTLYVNSVGPYNEEGFLAAKNAYLAQVSDPAVASFSSIEIWDDQTLGSPLMFEGIEAFWSIIHTFGCTSLALVIPTRVQKILIRKMLPEIGNVFDNIADAEAWIAERNLS